MDENEEPKKEEALSHDRIDNVVETTLYNFKLAGDFVSNQGRNLAEMWGNMAHLHLLSMTLGHYLWLMYGEKDIVIPKEIIERHPLNTSIPEGFTYSIFPNDQGEVVIHFWIKPPKDQE